MLDTRPGDMFICSGLSAASQIVLVVIDVDEHGVRYWVMQGNARRIERGHALRVAFDKWIKWSGIEHIRCPECDDEPPRASGD